MGSLQNTKSGSRVRLAARCLVGRGSSCHLVLDDEDVSREQAVIFYHETGWRIRDLSSTNGTFVQGDRIRDTVALELGAAIRFGNSASVWVLSEDGPPFARAISSRGEVIVATGSGLIIPGSEGVEAYVSQHDGEWLLERHGEVRPLCDMEEATFGNATWRFELTTGDQAPQASTAIATGKEPQLIFNVSPDEEHVEIVFQSGVERHVLAHRSHSYLLLLLARVRLDDQQSETTTSAEQGWIETKELASMMRSSNEQVNLWIWRAREQFERVSADLASRLVERRPTLGLLRLGVGNVSIVKR